VPAATPVPHVPAVLLLGSATDLLTGPGCSVCRYASQASDGYLAWFCFEGHAQADAITRLCASLGMCSRHTRRLMCQPGAAIRLTAVYRYVMAAAQDRLAAPARPLGRCPACEHDRDAADRAVQILADDAVQARRGETCGLCPPHLRMVSAQVNRRQSAWLAEAVTEAAGRADHDAPSRAALRRAALAGAPPGGHACIACRAASQSTEDGLARLRRVAGLLCAEHVGDLIVSAGRRQTEAILARPVKGQAVDHAGQPASRRRSRLRRIDGPARCPACLAAEDAELRVVDDLRHSLRTAGWARDSSVPLCVRHLLGLRARDPRAAHVLIPAAAGHAETLTAELDEAFGKNTWLRRHEARGPEMSAWRRAAAFLDGDVFCGGPPGG
jgi:hypothetical protein